MQYFNKSILLSSDDGSGGIGEDLGVTSPLKRSWVKVPTDIKQLPPPHIIVEHDDYQHNYR